jgi:hypothetical protein
MMNEKISCARKDLMFNTNKKNIDFKLIKFGINHDIFIY